MPSGERQYTIEPFFAALRQRRPDVDIVILPPVKVKTGRPEASTEDLERSISMVDATGAAIAARVPDAVVEEPTWDPLGPEGVRCRTQVTAATADGDSILDTLDAAFRQAGWHTEVAVKAYHRWTATHPEVGIFGTWSDHHDSLRIIVTGRVLNTEIKTAEAPG
jgi:hypothetical protein